MDINQKQDQPLSTNELVFLALSLGSVLASLHFLLSVAF